MRRYIDAEELIKSLEKRRLILKYTIPVADALLIQGRVIREGIENAPTADVVEVKHGEWLLGKYKCMDRSVCSVCNSVYEGGDTWNYCPNCGAKMDGERKAEQCEKD